MRRLTTAQHLFLAALVSGQAAASPTVQQVRAGDVDIVRSDGQTQVRQFDDRAIIDWSDFDVAAGESVVFDQPSAQAISLNRILDDHASRIDGRVSANGQLFLINQYGIVFGEGARIDSASLLVTTANIDDEDFLAGRYDFSGNGIGEVINRGVLNAADGGWIALVAPNVTNAGSITAPSGRVGVHAADSFVFDLSTDGLVQARVPADGAIDGSLRQSGRIAGEEVTLGALGVESVLDAVINMDGIVQADAVHRDGGVIVLAAGGGTAAVNGTLQASGGRIDVLGETVSLGDEAVIDVSGAAGGGRIAVGGGFGGEGLPASDSTHVASGARLSSDALTDGDGGDVVVWSDGYTDFRGHISARGAGAGSGGQVEVSSAETLRFRGSVDLGADGGEFGDLLLDPRNITIADGGTDDLAGAVGDDGDARTYSFAEDPAADATLDADTLVTLLGSGNVTLQAHDDITVDETIDSSAEAGAAGNGLTLQAGDDIFLNASIRTRDGAITLTAGDSSATPVAKDGLGDISFADGVIVDAGTADVALSAEGAMQLEAIAGGTVTLDAGASISRTSADAGIAATTLSIPGAAGIGTVAAPLPLTVGGLDIGALGGAVYLAETDDIDLDVTTDGIFELAAGGDITASWLATSNDDVSLSAAGGIAVGAIDAGTGAVTLDADGAVTDITGSLAAASLAVVDATAVGTAAAPLSTTVGSASFANVDGGIHVDETDAIVVSSAITPGRFALNAGGDITIAAFGGGIAADSGITLDAGSGGSLAVHDALATQGDAVSVSSSSDAVFGTDGDVTSGGGAIAVNAGGGLSMASGTVLDAGAGTITLGAADDIILGALQTTNATASAVAIESSGGSLVDGSGGVATNITAGSGGARVTLTAGGDIGAVTDPLNEAGFAPITTTADELSVTSGGAAAIEDSGSLTLLRLDAGTVLVKAAGALDASGVTGIGSDDRIGLVAGGSLSLPNTLTAATLRLEGSDVVDVDGAALTLGATDLLLDSGAAETLQLTLADGGRLDAATGGALAVAETGVGSMQLADLDGDGAAVAASGTVSIAAAGDLGSTATIDSGGNAIDLSADNGGSLALGAGVSSGGGSVTLSAAGGVAFDGNGDIDSANGVVTIEADSDGSGAGAITMADGAVVDAGSGTIALSAADDITLGGLRTTNATAAAVSVSSLGGSILDGGDSDLDIVANQAGAVTTLRSATGIDALDVRLAALDGANSTSGAVTLNETDALTVSRLTNAAGAVGLTSGGDLTVAAAGGGVATGDASSVSLTAGGALMVNDAVTSTGGAVSLTAAGDVTLAAAGDIGSADGGVTVTADSDGSGAGAITMADGTVIDAGSGAIALNAADDITLGGLRTTNTTAAAVSVISGGGAIRDGGDTDLDILANQAGAVTSLRSATGIDALEVRLAVLDGANSALGAITLNEADALTVNRLTNAGGTVGLTTGGDLTVSAVGGGVDTGDASAVSLTAGGALTVNDTVTAAGGAVNLTAAEDIVFGAAGDVGSADGGVTVTADNDGSGAGAIVMADGAVIDAGSGTIALTATDAITLGKLRTTNATAGAIAVTSSAGGVGGAGVGSVHMEAAGGRITVAAAGDIGAASDIFTEAGYAPVNTTAAELDLASGGVIAVHDSGSPGLLRADAAAGVAGAVLVKTDGALDASAAAGLEAVDNIGLVAGGTLMLPASTTGRVLRLQGAELTAAGGGNPDLNAADILIASGSTETVDITLDDGGRLDASALSLTIANDGGSANGAATMAIADLDGDGSGAAVGGAFQLATDTALDLSAPIDTSGDVVLEADTDITAAAAGDLTSGDGNVTLTADADNAGGGAITFDDGAVVDAGSGAIALSAEDDITLGGLRTTNASAAAVSVTSLSGSIRDGGDSHLDIDANEAGAVTTLRSATGIEALEVRLAALDGANSVSGAVTLNEADALMVNRLTNAAGAVGLTSGGDLTVAAAGGGVATGDASSVSLTVGGALTVNDTVASNGGAVTLTAAGDVTLAAAGDIGSANGGVAVTADSAGSGAGAIIMADGTVIDAGSGTIALSAADDITLGGLRTTNATAAAVSVTSDGGAIRDGGGSDLEIVANQAGAVTTLRSATGIEALDVDLAELDAVNSTSGDVTLTEADDLTVDQLVLTDGSAVNLISGGALTLNNTIASAGGPVSLASAGGIALGASGDIASSGGDVTLQADSDGSGSGAITMADGALIDAGSGTITLSAPDDITLGGLRTTNVTASAVSVTSTGGAIRDGGNSHREIVANADGAVTTLRSAAGIEDLEIRIAALDAVNSASGAVTLNEADALTVTRVSATGAIGLSTGGGLTVDAAGSGVGTTGAAAASLTSGAGLTLNDGVTSVGGPVTLAAAGDVALDAAGDVGSGGGDVTVVADSDGSGAGTVTFADGAVIDAGSGTIDLNAPGDITLGSLRTTNATAAAVSVVSTGGSILDGGDTDTDIVASQTGATVTLTAAQDIGTLDTFANGVENSGELSGAPLQVASRTLNIDAGGDVHVNTVGAVATRVDNLSAGGDVRVLHASATDLAFGQVNAGGGVRFEMAQTSTLLTPGHIDAGGDITLVADRLQLTGIAGDLNGTGTVFIQPAAANLDMVVGPDASAGLSFSTADLAVLGPGVERLVVGRADGTGTVTLLDGADFPISVELRAGGSGGRLLQSGTVTAQADLVLAGNSNHLDGTLIASGDITVDGDALVTTVRVENASRTVRFTGAVDAAVGAVGDIVIDAPGSDISFVGDVGATRSPRLVHVETADDVVFDGSLTAGTIRQDAGSGETAFMGAVTTSADMALTGTDFRLLGAVTGAGGMSVSQSGQLTVGAEGDIDLAGSFGQSTDADVRLAGDIVTAGGTVEFNGPVVLTGDVEIATDSDGASGADIRFHQTLDGEVGAARALTLDAGDGDILWAAAAGGANRLGAVTVRDAALWDVRSSIAASGLQQAAGSRLTRFASTVDSEGDVSLTGTAFEFNGAVSVTGSLSVANSGRLVLGRSAVETAGDTGSTDGMAAASPAFLISASDGIDQSGGGYIDIGADLQTVGGDVSIADVAVLSSDVSVTTDGGDVRFLNTLDAAVAGRESLSLDVGGGAVELQADTGSRQRIGTFAVDGHGGLSAAGVKARLLAIDGTGDVVVTGRLDFSDASTLGGSRMTLGDVAGASSLTVANMGEWHQTGAFTLQGELHQTGNGAVRMEHDLVADGVTLSGNVRLADSLTIDTTRTDADGGAVVLGGDVDGTVDRQQGLAVRAGGARVAMRGEIGVKVPLAYLDVRTTGSQVGGDSLVSDRIRVEDAAGNVSEFQVADVLARLEEQSLASQANARSIQPAFSGPALSRPAALRNAGYNGLTQGIELADGADVYRGLEYLFNYDGPVVLQSAGDGGIELDVGYGEAAK